MTSTRKQSSVAGDGVWLTSLPVGCPKERKPLEGVFLLFRMSEWILLRDEPAAVSSIRMMVKCPFLIRHVLYVLYDAESGAPNHRERRTVWPRSMRAEGRLPFSSGDTSCSSIHGSGWF